MAEPLVPDVVVNVCSNCIPAGEHLPRQWVREGIHVLVWEIPCSGKVDGQYLLHSLESASHGICVVACAKGSCRLTQGNYRAEVRLRTIQRLLSEIGLEAQRIELVYCPAQGTPGALRQLLDGAVERIRALGPSALHKRAQQSAAGGEVKADAKARADAEAKADAEAQAEAEAEAEASARAAPPGP